MREEGSSSMSAPTPCAAQNSSICAVPAIPPLPAVAHDLAPLLELLTLDGTLSQVGYLGPRCPGRRRSSRAPGSSPPRQWTPAGGARRGDGRRRPWPQNG